MSALYPFDLAGGRMVQSPFRGAPQTVKSIIKHAVAAQTHLQVRQLAERICAQLREKDYLSEALAVYHYVLAHTRYTRDPRTIELVKAPYRIIDQLIAGEQPLIDCDDLTTVMASLLLSLGHDVRIVTVAFGNAYYKGERQYSHVFCQSREAKTGVWITLDPVAGENTKAMHSKTVAAKVYEI